MPTLTTPQELRDNLYHTILATGMSLEEAKGVLADVSDDLDAELERREQEDRVENTDSADAS